MTKGPEWACVRYSVPCVICDERTIVFACLFVCVLLFVCLLFFQFVGIYVYSCACVNACGGEINFSTNCIE